MKSRWVQKKFRKSGKGPEDMETKSPLEGQRNEKGLERNLTTKMQLKIKKKVFAAIDQKKVFTTVW